MKFITVILDKRTCGSFILLSLRIKCLVAWKKKTYWHLWGNTCLYILGRGWRQCVRSANY